MSSESKRLGYDAETQSFVHGSAKPVNKSVFEKYIDEEIACKDRFFQAGYCGTAEAALAGEEADLGVDVGADVAACVGDAVGVDVVPMLETASVTTSVPGWHTQPHHCRRCRRTG